MERSDWEKCERKVRQKSDKEFCTFTADFIHSALPIPQSLIDQGSSVVIAEMIKLSVPERCVIEALSTKSFSLCIFTS